ncbi:hypothetical protein FA10DRAFT_75444 [Acaromyces ingoldii]|uniref:Uncharacterized protein n=1 Tax=Acaromyces ingoldii TaxID=215250 RepID=A0A316YRD0_9BASI|nr:hypothetical protein FA10DRAFT_75444 [Acaromyces ingoldii]PWN91791.1 hypothetical protein FA10DRAFT_75444 [Acaromyces ingoldii]
MKLSDSVFPVPPSLDRHFCLPSGKNLPAMKLFVWTLVVCSVSVTQVFSLPGLPINLSDSVHHTPSPPLETDNNPSTSLSLSSPGGSGLHRSPREHNLLNLDKSTTPGPSDGHAAEQDDVQPLHLTHLREPDTDDNNTGAEQQQQRSGTREAGTTRSPSRSRREGSSTLNRRGMILSKLSGKDGQSKNGESEKSRSKSGESQMNVLSVCLSFDRSKLTTM